MADYSSFIFNALNGVGDTFVDNRKRRDALTQQRLENELAQRRYADALMQDQRDFSYRQGRDAVGDQQWQQNYNLNRDKAYTTNDMLQFRAAKRDGFTGSFMDYLKAMGGGAGGGLGNVPIPLADINSGKYAVGRMGPNGLELAPPPEGYQPLSPYDKAFGSSAGRESGKGIGEAETSLRSLAAKMPGLENVVGQLDQLANKATYTEAGKAVDWFNRQAGLEPRESAVARSQYIAVVDNQVLPLLRDTFGAQFTQREGETLRATLGAPDKSPAEKQAVLKAFIEQKRRDVESLALQSGRSGAADNGSAPPGASGLAPGNYNWTPNGLQPAQ